MVHRLQEREERQRRQRGPGQQRPAQEQRRAGGRAQARRARRGQPHQPEQHDAQQDVEGRLRVTREVLQRDDHGQPRERERPRPSPQAVGQQAQPGRVGPDGRGGPRDPADHPEAEAEHRPRQQRAPEAQAEGAPEQVGPEGGDEQLERGHDRERVPEGQDVARQVQRGEDRRLRVGQVGTAAHDGRVPQRHGREDAARRLQERLEDLDRVDLVVVGPQRRDPAGALALHGVACQSMSEAERARPGTSPGANISSDSSA